MKRDLLPGTWGRCGRAIPDPQASELDNVVALRPREDMRQGRDCLTPCGPYSINAGKPRKPTDEEARRWLWGSYIESVLLTAACAAVIAYWPV